MPASIFFTLDLEDHLNRYDSSSRYLVMAPRILDFLDEIGVKGTVFVVGRLAEASPGLVREFSARGHEMACHSYRHLPLDQEQPGNFSAETKRAKDAIEQCTGQKVAGYRAPVFSLIRSTCWALDLLQQLGFSYSSSIMPAPNPLYGMPEAPAGPFRWPNGLVELPCPVSRMGPFRFPYLGGIYLRYVPELLRERMVRGAGATDCLWTYIHPYDFDSEEPYSRFPGRNLPGSLLLWLNRRQTFAKMRAVLRDRPGGRLADLVSEHSFRAKLPTWGAAAAHSGT